VSHVTKSGGAARQLTVMRSQLGIVRGLGSAKGGVHHWWVERITGLALIPLGLWFVYVVLALKGAPYAVVKHWAGEPINTVLLISLVALGFHHAQLGLQVVIEDYVHNEAARFAAVLLVKAASFLFALWGAISVLRLAFT
jgi:succinate dehydrogenase / fumarate reductase membrane anchor subunit